MKTLIAKNYFEKIWYEPNTFEPQTIIFKKGQNYNLTNENYNFIIINKCLFSKNEVYNYFLTIKEYRKLKLQKINEKTIKKYFISKLFHIFDK